MTRNPKRVFLICPVRNITTAEMVAIANYVSDLESAGARVHWPVRDTNQYDRSGLAICHDNRVAVSEADEVHVWWNPTSQGSLFDLGMAFALHKPVRLANSVSPTPGKSFGNVLQDLDAIAQQEVRG